jgi:hypothetical protein
MRLGAVHSSLIASVGFSAGPSTSKLNPPEGEEQIIFDLPRPRCDDVVSPERDFVNRMAETCARAATPVEPDGYDGYTSIPDKSQ